MRRRHLQHRRAGNGAGSDFRPRVDLGNFKGKSAGRQTAAWAVTADDVHHAVGRGGRQLHRCRPERACSDATRLSVAPRRSEQIASCGSLTKLSKRFRQPVIPAGGSRLAIHPLLDDTPVAGGCEEECVVIELISILDGGAVHLRRHAARVHEGLSGPSPAARMRSAISAGVFREVAPLPPWAYSPSSPPTAARPSFSAP